MNALYVITMSSTSEILNHTSGVVCHLMPLCLNWCLEFSSGSNISKSSDHGFHAESAESIIVS